MTIKVRGVQHIGLTVPDMEDAVRFFEGVFGAATVLSTGRIDVDDRYMIAKLGVPGHCRIRDLRMLRCGNATNIELFEYEGEEPSEIKRNSQVGAFHIGLEVEDATASAARLREMGVDVLDGPTLVDSGPFKGLTWVYLRAPWGQFFELVSTTGPLGYEAEGGVRMWSIAKA
jgi:catechol 2,3-dioxygenase-like lactoylglutathione lyase family enzyme